MTDTHRPYSISKRILIVQFNHKKQELRFILLLKFYQILRVNFTFSLEEPARFGLTPIHIHNKDAA